MNFVVAVTVFPIIFIGELPDKTMFASLVMSTRGRPFRVWLGSASAFAVHVVIATTIGVTLFHVLPRRVVDGVVAGLFLAGAGLALREGLRERQHDEREEKLAEKESSSLGGRPALTAFVVIFLAEWGDLTQILTANLAARYHSPISVGVGALLALWAVAAIAVLSGQGLLKFVKISTIRFVTTAALVALAAYSGWTAFR
jgi:putative Ca2+/H+ antiporter (TMEM165/GDT1 family)